MKKSISILLCAVLLFGLIPVFPAAAAADTVIIADDFEDYCNAETVTTSVKGWSEFNARCHSLVTEGSNTYAKLTRGLTSSGGTENAPRVRKNVSASVGDIYMVESDVMMSEKGLVGFYLRLNGTTLSLVRFGGNALLNGTNTGYKSAPGKWMRYQMFFKLVPNGQAMEVYLRMWGEGIVDAQGNSVSESKPVVVSKAVTNTLNFSAGSDLWMYYQGSFGGGTAEDYAALDNVQITKLGEELLSLNDISVNGQTIPEFSTNKTEYALELDYGTTQAVVTAAAGAGKTVTIDCPTVTDFPRGVNITVTNDALGISKTYTVNLTVSSTADFDLLLADDFESYGTAEKVTNSVKGWSQITAASHSLVTDGTTRALKFSLVGTEKSPRARKNITAQVGDTIQVQADFKLSENGYIGLYLRNNSKTESIQLLKNTDVLINGATTGYEIDPEKWFTCNTHVKLAANGGLMEIYMCLWGEGVVDREGNAATRENPVKLSRTVNTVLDLESNSTLTIDFMGNFSKADSTDYALVDNVVMTKLHSDVAGITGLTVNDMEVEAVEGTDNQFSIMLPYGTEKAVILAEAGYGRTVTLSEAVVTTFPTDVTVTVENASAGVTKTYIVSVDAKRTENQMEGTLMLVYGGANGIFTMSYDDGLYETAAYLDQIGAKYDVYSSAMMVTSKLSKADRAKWQLLFDRGYIEPQNHSMTHLVLPSDDWAYTNGEGSENNTPENYQYQIVDSKDLLEEYFGNDIIFYAASNNTLSSGAWEVVMDTHYAARLGALGVNSLDPTEGTNPGQWHNLKCVWFSKDMEEIILPYIDIAAQQGGWFVGGCHSIGEFDRAGDVSLEDAERIFAYVSAYQKENKLWATTVSNAIKYVRERQNSRCYVDWVDGKVVVEVVSNGVLDKDIFNHALTVKAQIPAGWKQVTYTCGGEKFVADVFEENGMYWAYINVLPDTRVSVYDARVADVLFTENFDDYNPGLGDNFTGRGWNNITNNSYLTVNGIIGEQDIRYTGDGNGDYYPRAGVITPAKVGDTYVITGDVMRGAGATAYVYLYNAVANTGHAVFYINDNGVYFADTKMTCSAVNDQWIHYEIYVKLGANGEVCSATIVLYGGVKDASGNPITSSKPFTYSKNITMRAYDIAANGALQIRFASKVNAATSYTRWDNMAISALKNDEVVLTDIQLNGVSVENFYTTITEYTQMVSGQTQITATGAEGCTVTVDQATVTQYPATVTITVTKDGISRDYTLKLYKKLSENEKDSQILSVYGGAQSIVTMTFDDGYYDSVEILNQLLATYNLKASAMMIAERVNDSNVQQWIDLFSQGYVEPQNHSMTHLNLKDNPTDENYQTEVLDSQTRLENYFGNDIIAYAAAYNVLSEGAWETVMDSHYAARLGAYGINSLNPGRTTAAGDWYNLYNVPFKKTVTDQYSYLVNNLSRAAENGGWLITMCHGVGAGTNSEISEATASALFAQIARMQEGGKVWNATFSEAVKYLWQYQNMISHAQWIGSDVYVSLENTGIVLPEDIFDQVMTVKVQVPESWKEASYVSGGKTVKAAVFTEDGKAYIYVDVTPGKTVRVVDSSALAQEDAALKFAGANVTLQSNMAVTYKVRESVLTGYTNPYVEVVFNGVKTTIADYTYQDGYYYFPFRNIAPDKVGDTLYATLYATKEGVLYAGLEREYSVATYCYSQLNKYASDDYAEFRTLLVDLLNYAAVSQQYTGHNTDNLANAKLTQTQRSWGTAQERTYNNVQTTKYQVIDNPTVAWKGGGLVLQDAVVMRFRFETDNTEGLTFRVQSAGKTWTIDSFSTEGGNTYIYFSGLHAGQMSEEVFVTAYRDGVAVSNTIRYSVESYAASKVTDTQTPYLAELVVAMMHYGDAAYAYTH